MKTKPELKRDVSEEQTKRLSKAKRNFEELKKEIAPFLKKKPKKTVSAGRDWRSTSDLVHGLLK